MEILQTQSAAIASAISKPGNNFDVVELGAGDCSKSIHLLKEIFKLDEDFTFFPIDISKHVIDLIEKDLPRQINELNIYGLNGEYIEMLKNQTTFPQGERLFCSWAAILAT
jgi:uncharacterized SAM-dependent methyltransferase